MDWLTEILGLIREFKKGAKSSFNWLSEARDAEMPDIPSLTVDEGNVKAQEIAMLEFYAV